MKKLILLAAMVTIVGLISCKKEEIQHSLNLSISNNCPQNENCHDYGQFIIVTSDYEVEDNDIVLWIEYENQKKFLNLTISQRSDNKWEIYAEIPNDISLPSCGIGGKKDLSTIKGGYKITIDNTTYSAETSGESCN